MALIELHHTRTRMEIMGRTFRLVALATNDEEANEYMMRHTGASVLHVDIAGTVYMADKQDKGTKAK